MLMSNSAVISMDVIECNHEVIEKLRNGVIKNV
ncbi:MAG: hypothetical protein HW406_64 [Candidatus Brocadiaceae bacterium]|nr:hypothetical protein [Candidatus Brocadiaceae bacterium]